MSISVMIRNFIYDFKQLVPFLASSPHICLHIYTLLMSVFFGYLLDVRRLAAESQRAWMPLIGLTWKAMSATELTTLSKYPQWSLEYQRILINVTFKRKILSAVTASERHFQRGKESVAVLGIKVRFAGCKSCVLTTKLFPSQKIQFCPGLYP